MISGSQVILSITVLFILYRTFLSYKNGRITFVFTILWGSLWISILIFINWQRLLIQIANYLGIGRGVDLATYISIILIFYLVYRIFTKLEELNVKITKIIRNMALEKEMKIKK